jgi:hypothetical protein
MNAKDKYLSATLKPIYWLVVLIFIAIVTYIAIITYTYGDALVKLMVFLAIAYLGFGLSKVPFKVTLKSYNLNTYSLRGKKNINLNQLNKAEVKRAFPSTILNTNHGIDINLLKLTDRSGHSLFVQLGGLQNEKRKQLANLLKSCLVKAETKQEDQFILESWLDS